MSRATKLLSILSPETRDLLFDHLPASWRDEFATTFSKPIENAGEIASSQRLLHDFHMELIQYQGESHAIRAIVHRDPSEFCDLMQDEMPQTIAAVLLSVGHKTASDYLCAFPLPQRIEIVRSLLNRDRAHPSVLQLLTRLTTSHSEVEAIQNENSCDRSDGAAFLHELVAQCDLAQTTKLSVAIERADSEFAQRLPLKDAG